MACRVGITTDPEGRRTYWQKQAPGFANWEILEVFRSKPAAKEYETEYALRHGCEATLDGLDPPVTAREVDPQQEWWYVYHFDYSQKGD